MFEGLRLENVDIFYGHLEYNTDMWEIFDHFVFIWYIFSGFGIMHQKIWQPWSVPTYE
jgi:hypothetical protein